MDIERTILDDDLETMSRNVREYRTRVARAVTAIREIQKNHRVTLSWARSFEKDLITLLGILQGETVYDDEPTETA